MSFDLDYASLPIDLPIASFTYTVSVQPATVLGVTFQNLNQEVVDPTIDYSSSVGMVVESASIKVSSQVTEFPATVFYIKVGINTATGTQWAAKASLAEL